MKGGAVEVFFTIVIGGLVLIVLMVSILFAGSAVEWWRDSTFMKLYRARRDTRAAVNIAHNVGWIEICDYAMMLTSWLPGAYAARDSIEDTLVELDCTLLYLDRKEDLAEVAEVNEHIGAQEEICDDNTDFIDDAHKWINLFHQTAMSGNWDATTRKVLVGNFQALKRLRRQFHNELRGTRRDTRTFARDTRIQAA